MVTEMFAIPVPAGTVHARALAVLAGDDESGHATLPSALPNANVMLGVAHELPSDAALTAANEPPMVKETPPAAGTPVVRLRLVTDGGEKARVSEEVELCPLTETLSA